jgi:hypothetical protein
VVVVEDLLESLLSSEESIPVMKNEECCLSNLDLFTDVVIVDLLLFVVARVVEEEVTFLIVRLITSSF